MTTAIATKPVYLRPGVQVLDRRDLPARRGNMPAEVVLCFLEHNPATPYVTWQRNKGDGGTYWGHYFQPHERYAAEHDFRKRGRS